jgi:Bacterial regulatory proteins, luxR family
MKLPVDTSAIAFLCALAPEPVIDFQTKQHRADENGEPLYVIQLLAMGDGSADLLAVKVPAHRHRPSDELVVTLETVKKHLSHVFDKLGAANRSDAVVRARELRLIS